MAFWPVFLGLVLVGMGVGIGFGIAKSSKRPIGYAYFINFRDFTTNRSKGFEVEYVRASKNGSIGVTDPHDESKKIVQKKVSFSRFKPKPFPVDKNDLHELIPGRTWVYGLKVFYNELVGRVQRAESALFRATIEAHSLRSELLLLKNDPRKEAEYIQNKVNDSMIAQRQYVHQSKGGK